MKQTKLFLGIILGLVAIGSASALLVSYLSNTVTTTATVTTPLSVSDLAAVPSSIPAGSFVDFSTTVTNAANNPINGVYSLTVNNTDGVTCNDFVSATIDTVALTCNSISPTQVVFTSNSMTFIASGTSPTNNWEVTLQPNAAGVYDLGLQVTP